MTPVALVSADVVRRHAKALGPQGIAVYVALACLVGSPERVCYVTIEAIAELLGMPVLSVRQALAKLQALRLIKIAPRLGSAQLPRRFELFDDLGRRIYGVDGELLAVLPGNTLRGVDLSGRDLSWSDLVDADLRGANLRQTNLRNALLVGADLSGADLTDADLTWATLVGANLQDAVLLRTKLAEADLTGVRGDPDFSRSMR